MNSPQTKGKNISYAETEQSSPDPFASDILAETRIEEYAATETILPVASEKPAWVWKLPKVMRSAVDWNFLRRGLPADFFSDFPQRLADSMAHYLNVSSENPLEFLFLIERETDNIIESDDVSWWLNFSINPNETEFAIEIDDVFAVWLVDSAIGENQSNSAKIRNLTRSERAVIEFLAVNSAHEANVILNAPLFKFRGLSRQAPKSQTKETENPRLTASWQTVHGFLNSIVKIYITPEVFDALNATENNLLTAAPRRRTIWNSLQNRVRDVRARILLGAAQMTLADAAGLETNDIVLTENYNFSIVNGEMAGKAEIFLGEGERVKISGAFVSAEAGTPNNFQTANGGDLPVTRVKSNRVLQIAVERFEEAENPQLLIKSMSNEKIEDGEYFADENTDGEPNEGEAVALENLSVNLRVELEARRLSLSEVANLRLNQVIELGVRAADPVNLLIDDKIVARGELVEVEDRLGVRIIQIL